MAPLITFQFGIVLLLSRIPIDHGFTMDSKANVTPNDPVVEVGGTLVLNCTLTSIYNGTWNASDISFGHSGRNYSFPYVRALSNVTAQLRLPNITIDMSGLFRCSLPNSFLGVCAAQSVHVVRRPLQPVLDGCVITNWERMECRWSPSREDQLQHTQGAGSFVQKLFYRHPSDGNNWTSCPLNISEKCIWDESKFRMGATYCIQVNVTNILKYTISTDIMCIQAQEEIVKPNPPENVAWYSEDKDHVTLFWSPPTSKYDYAIPLVYQLAVRNQWQDQTRNFTVVNATSLKLPVIPDTQYVVQISVRPARPGFSSDKSVLNFKTPAAVPCKNPDTLRNAFFLQKEKRKVMLYWKPIEPKDFCGPDLSYVVHGRQSPSVTNSADDWRTVSSVMHDSSCEVTLIGEEHNEVTVLSKNGVGVANRLQHVIIHVPSSLSETNTSSNYRLVVEGNNNSVIVRWFVTAPTANVTDYTLFWCQHQSGHFCKTPIQWRNVSDADLEYKLTLSENYLHFQVGLAVNFLSGFTTGIMWADKLYSATAKADAPRIEEVVAPYLGFYGELDIRWTPAPCNVLRCAYIQTFVIFYCLADQQNSCQGDAESVNIAPWKSSTFSLTNLEHGALYKVWMTSISRTGSSKPSDPFYATTANSWVTAGAVAGIIVAILCAGTIAIGGLYIILRCLNKYQKKFVNGLNIALPPTQRVQLPSTSSEVPMLGKKYDYSRQESARSVSSGDSGRYSLTLTPASPAMLPLLAKLTDANENLDSFMTENYSKLEDTKVDNDEDDGMQGCVLSYTIPKVDTLMPNGATKVGDPTKPSVMLNGDIAGHTKYILPEHIEQLRANPRCTESDVNYITRFSFPSTLTSGDAVDIGYTKVENLQPLYNLANHSSSTDGVNEDPDLLQFDTSQEEAEPEQADLVPVIDQLLATLNADHPLISDLQADEPATNDENSERPLPPSPAESPPPLRPGEDGSPFRGYTIIANTDFPDLSCNNVEWGTGGQGFSQQLPLSNWGYVDHAMFGVDSVV